VVRGYHLLLLHFVLLLHLLLCKFADIEKQGASGAKGQRSNPISAQK